MVIDGVEEFGFERGEIPGIFEPTLPIFLVAGWPSQGIGRLSFTNG